MKVYNLSTRKIEEYENGYAARLIEHGKAVPAQKMTEGTPKAANYAHGKAVPKAAK